MGYYNNKELTEEEFKTINGIRYFATGDIGEMINGNLKIIDRKKDLVKLNGGEFVSLNKVECILKLLPFVDNCCVIAHPAQATCICLVSPVQKYIIELLNQIPTNVDALKVSDKIQDENKKSKNLNKLLNQNKNLVERLTKEAIDHCFSKGLTRFEIPTRLLFIPETWLPDTGLVTDSLKLKRKAIEKFYQKLIEKFYL